MHRSLAMPKAYAARSQMFSIHSRGNYRLVPKVIVPFGLVCCFRGGNEIKRVIWRARSICWTSPRNSTLLIMTILHPKTSMLIFTATSEEKQNKQQQKNIGRLVLEKRLNAGLLVSEKQPLSLSKCSRIRSDTCNFSVFLSPYHLNPSRYVQ